MADERAQEDRKPGKAASRGTQPETPETPAAPAPPAEGTYSVEQLREAAPQLLGVSRPTLDGALHGQTREAYTLDEAKRLVEEFLTRPHEEEGS